MNGNDDFPIAAMSVTLMPAMLARRRVLALIPALVNEQDRELAAQALTSLESSIRDLETITMRLYQDSLAKRPT